MDSIYKKNKFRVMTVPITCCYECFHYAKLSSDGNDLICLHPKNFGAVVSRASSEVHKDCPLLEVDRCSLKDYVKE